jgi:hypothetical protein
VTTPDWSATDAYHDEYLRLHAASEHVARAVAELLHAVQQVGDHTSAVALSEAIENLQLTQAQLATAAERAFSLAELARRSARQAAFQRQFDAAARQSAVDDGDWAPPPPATRRADWLSPPAAGDACQPPSAAPDDNAPR